MGMNLVTRRFIRACQLDLLNSFTSSPHAYRVECTFVCSAKYGCGFEHSKTRPAIDIWNVRYHTSLFASDYHSLAPLPRPRHILRLSFAFE